MRNVRIVDTCGWLAFVAVGAWLLVSSVGYGGDFGAQWDAVHRFIAGRTPYVSAARLPFDYPPSTLVVMSPLALLSRRTASLLWQPLLVVALAAVGAVAGRLHGRRPSIVALVVIASGPALIAVVNGGYEPLTALGLGVVLLLAARGRWLPAGAVLGVLLSIKPNVAAVLVVLVFARQGRAIATAVGVPVVLNLVGLSLLPGGFGGVGTTALSAWLHAVPGFVGISLRDTGSELGVPGWIVSVLRILVVGGLVFAAHRRWHGRGDGVRLTDAVGLLVLATVLGASFAFPSYLLLLVPTLVGATRPDSVFHDPLTAAAVLWLLVVRNYSPAETVMPSWTGTLPVLGLAAIALARLWAGRYAHRVRDERVSPCPRAAGS